MTPIKSGTSMTQEEYYAALRELSKLFDSQPGTPEAERVADLCFAIEEYEQYHFPLGQPTKEQAAQFRAEQEGRTYIPPVIESTPENIELVARTIYRQMNSAPYVEIDRRHWIAWENCDPQSPPVIFCRLAAAAVLVALQEVVDGQPQAEKTEAPEGRLPALQASQGRARGEESQESEAESAAKAPG